MQKIKRVPQDRQMIKYAVRLQLSGRVFVCFAACLLPQLVTWVLRLIPMDYGNVYFQIMEPVIFSASAPMYVLSFVTAVLVTDPMTVGVAKFFLIFNRTPEELPSPLSVCDCFGPGYLRLVRSMLLRTIVVLAWTIVPLCIGALIPGTWSIVEIDGLQVLLLHEWSYIFIIAAFVLNLYRSLVYAMVPYVLADNPFIQPVEALRRSAELMKGRLWEMLVMELSFFGWLLFVSVTFFIGAIYVYPYIEGTMAAYYIAFMEPMPWEMDLSNAD